VWIAASTHDKEDEQVLEAHGMVAATYPDSLLIIVPRHPERFDRVFEICNQRFKSYRRTQGESDLSSIQVYLGDTMGELLNLYAASDICFVGGSLVAHGGQNVLEPWLIGKPVIVGPHMFNFSRITEQGLQGNALIQVSSAKQLADKIMELAENQELSTQLVENARTLLNANKGALKGSMQLLQGYV
jgi:3-deoxy-D-manno-octulosonic-acid transferase